MVHCLQGSGWRLRNIPAGSSAKSAGEWVDFFFFFSFGLMHGNVFFFAPILPGGGLGWRHGVPAGSSVPSGALQRGKKSDFIFVVFGFLWGLLFATDWKHSLTSRWKN